MNWSEWARHWPVEVDIAETAAPQLWSSLAKTFRVNLSYADLMRPGRTGQILLERMCVDLTPLPQSLQELITSTSCQHRIEFFRREGEIDVLHQYDGRAMYLGCCRGLGIAGGKWFQIQGQDILPSERGRARIIFEAPANWYNIGLFACQNDEGGWVWPMCGETWADLCEIRFAREQGWMVHVEEKLVWPEGNPLDLWSERLGRLYIKTKETGNDALAGCYRAIALHTIGRMHNLGYRTEEIEVSETDDRATVADIRGVTATGVVIAERRSTNKPTYHCHPEWSAAIWSRARLRIAKAILSLPRGSVHAIYGDAIFTTVRSVDGREGWQDDGAAGRLRLTGSWPGPMAAPKNWKELRAITGGH